VCSQGTFISTANITEYNLTNNVFSFANVFTSSLVVSNSSLSSNEVSLTPYSTFVGSYGAIFVRDNFTISAETQVNLTVFTISVGNCAIIGKNTSLILNIDQNLENLSLNVLNYSCIIGNFSMISTNVSCIIITPIYLPTQLAVTFNVNSICFQPTHTGFVFLPGIIAGIIFGIVVFITISVIIGYKIWQFQHLLP